MKGGYLYSSLKGLSSTSLISGLFLILILKLPRVSLSVCEATSGSGCVFILLNSHCMSSSISEKHTQLSRWFLSVALSSRASGLDADLMAVGWHYACFFCISRMTEKVL